VRVLVTGASGFAGKAALSALVTRGCDVVAVSRTRPGVAGGYSWRAVDLLDTAATVAVVRDVRPEAILHLAWTVEHGKFWTTPANLDWVAATLTLARAAAESGVRRFIGTGTCYEYAWPDDAPCDETTTPVVPSLLYGISKDATRRVLEAYCASAGMEFAWARLFFLYGAGEHPARLVPSVAAALAAGQPARCGSGRGIRDFIDVRDAGAALAALTTSPVTGAVNIASGQAVSIAEVAQLLGRLAGRPDLVHLGALADRPGEPPRIVADVRRLQDEVGFRSARTLEAGLGELLPRTQPIVNLKRSSL
jgi:nucleoside-diphosphate-sugar epimerase